MSGQANLSPIDWKAIAEDLRRERRFNAALQGAIAVLSIGSMFLLALTDPWQRWGYVVGLAAQPFWLAATWRGSQIGMFVTSLFYTAALLLGVMNHFDF